MQDNKFHTPDGTYDFLPQQLFFKKEIEDRVLSVFNRYAFEMIKSPTFEYIEVFEGIGSVDSKMMYKFLDRNGDILALRSDMTPAIARMAATHYNEEKVPFRFCYIENAFRYNVEYQGKQREFTQAGVELIGISGVDADAEVIAVAVNSLIGAGLRDFRIDLGHMDFIEGILEETGLGNETSILIQKHIINREFTMVHEMIKDKELPRGTRELLSDLPMYIGNIDMLNKAEALTNNKKAKDALEKLKNIYEILCAYGVEKYILFDLSMIGLLDYYTGLIFRGYAAGTGSSLLGGGRYDSLISYFGADLPSVGFAIKIDELLSALEKQNTKQNSKPDFKSADTLLVYTEKGKHIALSTGDELRSQGLYIENSFCEDIDKNIAYARSKNMGGILFFIDDKRVRIMNLEAELIEEEVLIEELIKSVKN